MKVLVNTAINNYKGLGSGRAQASVSRIYSEFTLELFILPGCSNYWKMHWEITHTPPPSQVLIFRKPPLISDYMKMRFKCLHHVKSTPWWCIFFLDNENTDGLLTFIKTTCQEKI